MFRYDKAALSKITPYVLFAMTFFDKKEEGITTVIISQKKLLKIRMHPQTAESRNRVHVKNVGSFGELKC